MWFKNLTPFRFSQPFTLAPQDLSAALSRDLFRPCTSQEMTTHGWVSPLGRKAADLVHAVNGCLLICLQTEEKILPPAVVKEAVDARALAIEDREQRTVRRRERESIRDEVMQEFLPRAFARSRLTYAYVDCPGGWLVIDSASPRAVEELTHRLRLALGTLAIVPPPVVKAPAATMTAWLAQGDLPGDFALEDECELRDAGQAGGLIRCRGQDLGSEEILAHLQAGKQVTRLALTWNERLSFVLADDLGMRRLRFLDVVREPLADLAVETVEQVFDAEYALMTGELKLLLPRLLEIFGGEADYNRSSSASG